MLSTQVINEFLNVARIKMRLDLATRHQIAHTLLHGCTVVSLDVQVVAQAMAVEATYQVSYRDALVISAALAAGCDTLYPTFLCYLVAASRKPEGSATGGE